MTNGALPSRIADRLWAVETPLRFLGLQVGRRMAVIRLASGELFIHSPAELTPELRRALNELGPVRFVAAASSLHGHLFMEQYRAAYRDVTLFSAPGLERRRRDLAFEGALGDSPDPRWEGEIDQALFRGGRFITEAVFCHRESGTLLVGDLCWHVTPSMSFSSRLWAGWVPRVAPTPAFRIAITDRRAARDSIERILGWDFDRILIGHGEMVEAGGREALRRAYKWLPRSAA